LHQKLSTVFTLKSKPYLCYYRAYYVTYIISILAILRVPEPVLQYYSRIDR